MAKQKPISELELALEARTRLQLRKLRYLLIAIAVVILLLIEAFYYFVFKAPLFEIILDFILFVFVASFLISLAFRLVFTLHKRLIQNSHRLAGLHAISTAATQSLNLNQILHQSLDAITHLEKLQGAMATLINEQDRSLTNRAASGFSADFIDKVEDFQKIEQSSLAGQVILSKQPLIIQDIQNDPRVSPEHRQFTRENNIASLALLPITYREKIVGVLYVADKQVQRFGKEDVDWLISVTSQLGLAIENARLYQRTKTEKESKRRLARKVLRAQERERKIIATEVHDSLIQPLVAISNWTEALRKNKTTLTEGAKERLAEFSKVVRGAISLGRSLVAGLRPDLLELKGLALAAENFVEKTCVGKDIEVEFKADTLPELGEEIEIAAFRIIQEAVRNSLWHANASKLEVKIALNSNKNLMVSIKDNGRGFNPQKILSEKIESEHIGLATMIERATLAGGHTEIKSSPGQGTEVIAIFPPLRKKGLKKTG